MLEELLEFMPDAILLVDKQGQIVRANVNAEEMFGYASGELAGRSVDVLLPERFRNQHAGQRASFNANPHRRLMGSGLELFGTKKDGSEFAVDIMLGPVESDDVVRVIAVVRDISVNKQTERALGESVALYRVVADSAGDAIITIDVESNIHFANRATERIFGYAAEELVGEELTILMPERLRRVHKDGMRRYLDSGRKRIAWNAVELPGLRKDGVEISMELSFGEVNNDGTRLFTGVIRDITERKQAQALLDGSRVQLRRLATRLQSIREEERTRIAREVHDELGQMLTGLKFELSRLKSGISATGLLEQLDSSLGLVDATIRTVQRIAADLRPSVLDDIGLRPAIEWQAHEFQRRTEIDCEMDLGSEGIVLDRDRSTAVFRILQEVLTNVARHADANRVEILLAESESDLTLEVSDDGKGIANSEIDNQGSLGLLGMRERAHDLGGDLQIRRADAGGTVVTLRLPLTS